jgi:polyisoprenoid-binding protein YceI
MFKILSKTIVLLALPLISLSQTIDIQKSIVEFEIENMYFNTVEGTFSGFSGNVKFDVNNLKESKINVCVDASSVNTNNDERDEHLKKADFFHIEKYPEICFSSSSITKRTDGYLVEGMLKMHGVNKFVKIPLTYENKTLIATITVSRYDFNIGRETGTFMVGEDVSISIKCVLKS